MTQMKYQFKFNPLAAAIFTLLCGSTIQSSYAEANDTASTVDNKRLKDSIQKAYPGQEFFEQYYVEKSSPEAQVRDTKSLSSAFCSGTWITPISPTTQAVDPKEATSTVTADYAHYNPNGDSELEGNVLIDQQGRSVRADKVTIDKSQTYANAQGNVQLAQAGLLAKSDQVNYNLKTQQGDLKNSFYISEQQHAHGHAEEIQRTSPDVLVLHNATYTTCPPEQKPTWKIQAKEIELNQETGRGVTKGTKLYVKDVPVLAVPYFNFPIDDRRTTGILNPNLGFSNDGGLELTVPVYLNLAPNYDATLTPRYISDRGMMLENEFRYLTENFGQGRIWGGYLPNDRKHNDEDRKDFNLLHQWNINDYLSTGVEYHYASDKDYVTDLDNDPDSKNNLNLRRAWTIKYKNQIPGLTAQLKVENFQTLDKNTKDVDKPYARLPQFLLNYVTGNPLGLQYEYNNDTAYFKKNIDDAENYSTQPSGTRIYNQFATRYNFRTPWAFAIPEVSIRSINTFYDQNTVENLSLDSDNKSKSVVVPQFSLDTGLIFQRDGDYLQTITPRAFYAYAPYKNQTGYPNFDTTSASINYDQLFSPYRFYGHDRLEDNNFLSLGVSYSLFDLQGLERLRAGVGQSFYFSDRRVTLNNTDDNIDTAKNSGPIVSISSQLTNKFTVSANSAWMSNGDNAQHDFQTYYTGDHGNLYNLGYFNRKEIPDRQLAYDAAVASFVQPIMNNWRIMGHVQYDFRNNVAREYLLGVNYESCCYAISVYGRSYYNDLDNPKDPNVNVKRAVMAEITFKGLGGLNNKLASLLENRVLGFKEINQSWTQR